MLTSAGPHVYQTTNGQEDSVLASEYLEVYSGWQQQIEDNASQYFQDNNLGEKYCFCMGAQGSENGDLPWNGEIYWNEYGGLDGQCTTNTCGASSAPAGSESDWFRYTTVY
jgi:hypothetical protein